MSEVYAMLFLRMLFLRKQRKNFISGRQVHLSCAIELVYTKHARKHVLQKAGGVGKTHGSKIYD